MHINCVVVIVTILTLGTSLAAQTVRPPPQSEWDRATADLVSADPAARDAAVEKVKAWITGGWVSQDLWRKWIPSLVKTNSHQQIADLALAGILHRPEPLAAVPLAEARFKALYALNKPDDAGRAEFLAAAKSYYNVCDLKYTADAVTLVAQALARTRPDDPELVRKFRAEQAAASAGGAAPTAPAAAPATQDSGLSTQDSILKSVKIDPTLYADALQSFTAKSKFTDRVSYANLLLMADKSADAEKVFRELFQLASTQKELATATEGIAKSLRAQDGTVARANAFLTMIQNHNATQPADLPSTPPNLQPPNQQPVPPSPDPLIAHPCFMCHVSCIVFRVSCFMFRVSCFVFRVSCFVFRVSCFVFSP